MADKVWKILHRGHPRSQDEAIKILLKNRGLTSKKDQERFFSPSLDELFSLEVPGAKEAVKRIKKAIDKKEKIIVYSDYDCDGICGTAILWETLHELDANVFPYIPHRIKEGYGLAKETLATLAKDGAKLVITVDQGITAVHEIDFARSLGIDVIVTDHHIPPKTLPKAIIVHTTKLCGSGVAFVLSAKIFEVFGKGKEKALSKLDLATIATIADMVPLVGPNRTIVKFGLDYLSNTKRPGLRAIYRLSGLKTDKLSTYDISHVIAPRINAMGRLEHGLESLKLLLTKNEKRVYELAKVLNDTNTKRQKLTVEHLKLGKELYDEGPVGIIIHKDFHEGVIGLIAQKLVEEFYKPMVVIAKGDKFSKGSARSVNGLNIVEALRVCEEYLVEVGGHPMAAGFKIATEKLKPFVQKLKKVCAARISGKAIFPTLSVDCPLSLEHIDFHLLERLQKFSPFGVGNPEPVFLTKELAVEDVRLVGSSSNHVKLQLGGNPKSIEAIGFGFAERAFSIRSGMGIDVVYALTRDSWDGQDRILLKLKDFRSEIR